MTEVDMRALALRGAQQTVDEIFAQFPELRPAPVPPTLTARTRTPPRPRALTPEGRRRLSAAMKKRWKVAKANTANNGE